MIGLETRGHRPGSHERGAVSRYVYEKLERAFRERRPYVIHEALWGVPCGPTLSMLAPKPWLLDWYAYAIIRRPDSFVRITDVTS